MTTLRSQYEAGEIVANTKSNLLQQEINKMNERGKPKAQEVEDDDIPF